MKNGPERFEYYLVQIEKLLRQASVQDDPGLWLYENNARTPLFMLEGLAKLYSGLHDKKRFEKIEAHFKLLEDTLGAIDYYDTFAKQFSTDKNVSAATAKIIAGKATEKTDLLNSILKKKGWLGKKPDRVGKIRKRLGEMNWFGPKPEVKAIEKFYQSNINKIDAFAAQYRSGFTSLESQVHELRRKLRWLSIYPQALQGCVQLDKKPSNDKNVSKYLTPEIVNSPFNKLPPIDSNTFVLRLNRDYFFALSPVKNFQLCERSEAAKYWWWTRMQPFCSRCYPRSKPVAIRSLIAPA